LSVLRDDIQGAESMIRGTDVADEMMDYTRNNILVQSDRAMLAQDNQLPQGVLRLLQYAFIALYPFVGSQPMRGGGGRKPASLF